MRNVKALEKIVYDESLFNKTYVFRDRFEGGKALARLLKKVNARFDKVFAIPAGGIPVGIVVAKEFNKPLDLIVVKKVTYPWTTEAGFGAVAPDGSVVLAQVPLTEEEIRAQVEIALKKVLEREVKLRGGREYEVPPKVIVVDDGIATGYTMIAAIKFLRNKGAEYVIAGAPTGSLEGCLHVAKYADLVVVPNLRTGPYFAVAEAYQEWRDLEDEEVLEMLGEFYADRGGG